MMIRWIAAAAAVAVLAGQPAARAARQESDEARRLREAATVFGDIMAAEDKAIPRALLGKADGIAIFPSTVRAGFILGGMRGRGVLSARTDYGWSAPAASPVRARRSPTVAASSGVGAAASSARYIPSARG